MTVPRALCGYIAAAVLVGAVAALSHLVAPWIAGWV